MNIIDFSKLVKLKNPEKGEENLIFKVVNFNEVTNRCIIQVQNLQNWGNALVPTELVSINDIVNVDVIDN